MISVFFSYSHKDEMLRDQLETHLAMLRRQDVISVWHDRRLAAGKDVDNGINAELERAGVVLFLVSADFLASEYCYGIEAKRALERHTSGEARVIPVILRPCDWHDAPFGRLRASPRDEKPVTTWANQDEAFVDIVRDIRTAAKEILGDASQDLAPKEIIIEQLPTRSIKERDCRSWLNDTVKWYCSIAGKKVTQRYMCKVTKSGSRQYGYKCDRCDKFQVEYEFE